MLSAYVKKVLASFFWEKQKKAIFVASPAPPCAKHPNLHYCPTDLKFGYTNYYKTVYKCQLMEDQSKLSANRRKSMQLFILNSLITEIKKGKHINLNEMPADIVELLYEEAATNEKLRAALETKNKD